MITANNIRFGYPWKIPLFQELTLHLSPGSMAGWLGLNGAGKTTLLKLLCGLRFPSSGSCELFGRNVATRHPESLQNLIFIAEESELPDLTLHAYETLYAPFYPRFNHELFQQALKLLNLEGADNCRMGRLSFGQKRKCHLAFALAANTPFLILDEPTNGLDIPAKMALRRLLAAAAGDDRCILISTHQVRELDLLLDPVVILDRGAILLNASIAEISRRLSFHTESAKPADGDRLHAEPGLGGWRIVRETHDAQEETPVDLELLFNAVLANPARIREIFAPQAPPPVSHPRPL